MDGLVSLFTSDGVELRVSSVKAEVLVASGEFVVAPDKPRPARAKRATKATTNQE